MERTVTVVPETGLHARPAAAFVDTANEYGGKITVVPAESDDDPVDARSMLAVTSLGIDAGDDVTLYADGDDAAAALDALEEVLTTSERDPDESGD